MGTVTLFRSANNQQSVSSLSLVKDDLIKVEDNRFVPVDGEVESGTGLISVAVMTGESQPITVFPGCKIEAGSQKISGDWILKVEKLSNESRLAKILKDTENAAKSKPQIIHLSDKIARWFMALVLLTALGLVVFFASSHLAHLSEGISRALALVS